MYTAKVLRQMWEAAELKWTRELFFFFLKKRYIAAIT